MRSPALTAALPVALAATVLFAACGRGGGTSATPSPAPTPAAAVPSPAVRPARSAPPTAPPVHVQAVAGGGKYVTIAETRAGRKIYDITALGSEAQTGAGGATAHLDRPHITFRDPQNRVTIADAPEATVTERDKSVVMDGGVRARSQAGAVLTCDRLRYEGATERFHGDGHVTLRSPGGLTLTGARIDGDLRLENVRVSGAAAP